MASFEKQNFVVQLIIHSMQHQRIKNNVLSLADNFTFFAFFIIWTHGKTQLFNNLLQIWLTPKFQPTIRSWHINVCPYIQVLMWESDTTSVNVTYSYTTSDGILYSTDSVQQKTWDTLMTWVILTHCPHHSDGHFVGVLSCCQQNDSALSAETAHVHSQCVALSDPPRLGFHPHPPTGIHPDSKTLWQHQNPS